MKLDPPAMFAFEHSTGGYGTPDTPTPEKQSSSGSISLHTAIEDYETSLDLRCVVSGGHTIWRR